MTPGQTPSLLSHELPGCLITGKTANDLWRTLLLLWTIAGLITGGAFINGIGMADLVTTSITADGSVMSRSGYLSDDNSLVSRIFGSGWTSIDRQTGTSESRASIVNAQSDGPLLIGEYSSFRQRQKENPVVCVFGNMSEPQEQSEIEASGIIQHGSYASLRIPKTFESITSANGTGIIDLRHRLTGNGTVTGRTVATGNLSVSEEITADQGEIP